MVIMKIVLSFSCSWKNDNHTFEACGKVVVTKLNKKDTKRICHFDHLLQSQGYLCLELWKILVSLKRKNSPTAVKVVRSCHLGLQSFKTHFGSRGL